MQGDPALPELIAGLLHSAQQSRPIVDVCGEDVRNHVTRQIGDQNVEDHRGIALFIGETRPVKIAGFPGLAKEPALKRRGGGEYPSIEQSAGVALRHRRVRLAEVFGKTLWTGTRGVFVGEVFQFSARVSPLRRLAGKLAAKISGQEESFCRQQLRNQRSSAFRMPQALACLFQTHRRQTFSEDAQYFFLELRVRGGSDQELLAETLVESDGMHLVLARSEEHT